MIQFNVTGMSCAACSARVEKAVSTVKGVTTVSVSLLTNSMAVEGTARAEDIISAVIGAGYGASLKSDSQPLADSQLQDNDTPKLKKRLLYSLGFLIALMYVSMGHNMANLPLPDFLSSNYLALAIIQAVLALIVLVINNKFFINGAKGVIHKSPNMDTLVALGSGVSFVYSLVGVAQIAIASTIQLAATHYHNLYFESSAMIVTLITVGKMLESYSKGKTTNALKSLISLAPKTATIIVDNQQITIPADNVKVGDVFIVKPGESVAVDAVVIEGSTAVDESALTGESIPVDKTVGDSVSAATINQSGFIKCRATQVGQNTTLSKIIKMVSDAAATKAPIAKIADKVSGVFVPVVIAIAVITIVIWLLLGESVAFSLARGISVLVISCPCALGLATPVAIMVGNGVGAKHGVLFKTAESLEQAGKATVVVLDKTGTITQGTPTVTDIICAQGVTQNQLLSYAYSLEQNSEHPLAKAVVTYAKNNNINCYQINDFTALVGNGLQAYIDSKQLVGGSLKFISNFIPVNSDFLTQIQDVSNQGKTPLLFALDGKLLGVIAVADTVKSDSALAVKQLQNMGICVVMLTGDNQQTANAIGTQVGVDKVIAGVLPNDKAAVVQSLKLDGNVIMVGDGINDAPALTSANVGIAIGAGTDVAIDAADVVLMNNSLLDACAAIRLSRATLANIRQNLFWAFIYNIIGIPLAAGLWISLFGLTLNPMFGAAAMSLSSFCVVTNALKLNFVNIYNPKKDKKIKIKHNKKEVKAMTKVVKIDGMMCPHCEMFVKNLLEQFPQVILAQADHKQKQAVLTLSAPLDDSEIKNVIEANGYKIID